MKSTENSPKIVYMVFKKQERKGDWKTRLEPYCTEKPVLIHKGRKRTNEFSITFKKTMLGNRFRGSEESCVLLNDLKRPAD